MRWPFSGGRAQVRGGCGYTLSMSEYGDSPGCTMRYQSLGKKGGSWSPSQRRAQRQQQGPEDGGGQSRQEDRAGGTGLPSRAQEGHGCRSARNRAVSAELP